MTSHEPHAQPLPSHAPLTIPEPTIRRLLAALDHDDAGDATIGALHIAICERVRAMRDAGDPPEAVLSRMKRLTAATVNDPANSRGTRAGEASALVAQVAQWCIAEYFRKA